MPALNPFVWSHPLESPSQIVGMDDFARDVALTLKAQTNVMLFGPRDTGKTSFTSLLAEELVKSHGDDAPGYLTIRINLQRAFSIPAFISAVYDSMTNSRAEAVRRAGRRQLAVLEKEIGFDIKVIKGSVKRPARSLGQDAETLHAQLHSLTKLGDHVVVIFDEFQKLNRCPGEPLAQIRSALMDVGANNVSLVFTGSLREALEMMLNNSNEPIFSEAAPVELPQITEPDFFDYLEMQFEATGRQISEEGALHLLKTTGCHPKRTQHLAWKVWQNGVPRQTFDIEDVEQALDDLLAEQRSEFVIIDETLASGADQEENERRALYLLADRGSANLTSRVWSELYGFGSHTTARLALERLEKRALVWTRNDGWEIVDPFLAEWLRRNSPFA